jgi:predicted kinase
VRAAPGGPVPGAAGLVVILTGPPGAGKTTVAGAIAARSAQAAVHLHSDDFYHYIKAGGIEPYLPAAHLQNRVVIDVLADAAFGYAAGGYLVLLDGILGPWFLDPFAERSDRTGIALHYIVLRPALEESLRRARERSGGLRDSAPIRDLHRQFGQLGALEKHVIDSTSLSPEQTITKINGVVRSGLARPSSPRGPGSARSW